MRRSLIIGLVGSSIGFGACGGGAPVGKATNDELAKSVVEALAKKDKAAFVGLYAKVEGLVSVCSAVEPMKDMIGEKLKKSVDKASTTFDECAKMDWSKAKVVAITGGEDKKKPSPCPDVGEIKDISVEAEIDGKKVTLTLDDPFKIKGTLFLGDSFDCESAAPAVADAPPTAVADAPPAAAPAAAAPTPTEPTPAAPAPAADAPAAPAAPAAAGSGECDKFVTAYEACLKALPEAVRGQAESGLKQMKEMFAKVPDKAMLDATCKQSYDSAKTAMGSLCPDAFK